MPHFTACWLHPCARATLCPCPSAPGPCPGGLSCAPFPLPLLALALQLTALLRGCWRWRLSPQTGWVDLWVLREADWMPVVFSLALFFSNALSSLTFCFSLCVCSLQSSSPRGWGSSFCSSLKNSAGHIVGAQGEAEVTGGWGNTFILWDEVLPNSRVEGKANSDL